jgi:transcriptional regulator with XRE-family HTH domain
MKHFGSNLKAYRKLRNLTQNELATMIDSSSSHLCEIESGKRSVSLEKALAIAAALGCEIGNLAGGKVKLSITPMRKPTMVKE